MRLKMRAPTPRLRRTLQRRGEFRARDFFRVRDKIKDERMLNRRDGV